MFLQIPLIYFSSQSYFSSSLWLCLSTVFFLLSVITFSSARKGQTAWVLGLVWSMRHIIADNNNSKNVYLSIFWRVLKILFMSRRYISKRSSVSALCNTYSMGKSSGRMTLQFFSHMTSCFFCVCLINIKTEKLLKKSQFIVAIMYVITVILSHGCSTMLYSM